MFIVNPKKQFQKIDRESFLINNEKTGIWMFNDGMAECGLIDWCRQFGDKEGIMLDIGAHIGTYSWSLANEFSKVVAFECNTPVFNCMCGNIYLKSL